MILSKLGLLFVVFVDVVGQLWRSPRMRQITSKIAP